MSVLISSLFSLIHVSHDFTDLFFTWGTTHASEHRANHLFINRRVFSELLLENVAGHKETDNRTNNNHADA